MFIHQVVNSSRWMLTPTFQKGRALIPVRYLANALGAQRSWDANTQEITIAKGNVDIELTIGSTTLTVNGKALLMVSPGDQKW